MRTRLKDASTILPAHVQYTFFAIHLISWGLSVFLTWLGNYHYSAAET